MLSLPLALLGPAACDLLDVDNPNNVSEEALNPAAAGPIVNGQLASLVRAFNSILGPYSTATDELTWQGSREAYGVLDRGTVRDQFNEFVDAASFYVFEARWLSNQAVRRLQAFDDSATLTDRALLARANLYAAVTYDFIANMYDDFVIASDRQTAGDPVGPSNMITLYDSAIAATTRGLAIARDVNDDTLEIQNLLMRARARFDRAVWQRLNPSRVTPPANPLVNDALATADATAALALIGEGDYRLRLVIENLDVIDGAVSVSSNVNSRQEMRIGDRYGARSSGGSASLQDPVSGTPDRALDALIKEFVAGSQTSTMTVTGARDAALILAEAALAAGNTAEFTTQINRVRALTSKTPWAGTPAALEILKHERMANLWLQGRRLNDMYRFGITDSQWVAGSEAATCPGSLFPITVTERQSNSRVTVLPACGQ